MKGVEVSAGTNAICQQCRIGDGMWRSSEQPSKRYDEQTPISISSHDYRAEMKEKLNSVLSLQRTRSKFSQMKSGTISQFFPRPSTQIKPVMAIGEFAIPFLRFSPRIGIDRNDMRPFILNGEVVPFRWIQLLISYFLLPLSNRLSTDRWLTHFFLSHVSLATCSINQLQQVGGVCLIYCTTR